MDFRKILFVFPLRLDLVPINRSVGLKAKPTKPVTEVLRPVVAKYGLHLSDLVARIVSPSSLHPGSCRQAESERQTGGQRVCCNVTLVYRVCVRVQSGELEPLDLGLPISNLDGLRVVLDVAEQTPAKGKEHALSRGSNLTRCHVWI